MSRPSTPRLPNLARRTIPVAVHVPTQMPLGLRWDQPIERVHQVPEPEPVPVAIRRAVAA